MRSCVPGPAAAVATNWIGLPESPDAETSMVSAFTPAIVPSCQLTDAAPAPLVDTVALVALPFARLPLRGVKVTDTFPTPLPKPSVTRTLGAKPEVFTTPDPDSGPDAASVCADPT